MTRSTSGPLTPPFSDPESAFRKKGTSTSTANLSDVEVSDSDGETVRDTNTNEMADIANMTLEEYATRTTNAERTGVVRPTIPNNTNFELKGHILHMLRDIPFNGNADENAHDHVEEVLEIANYFKVPGVAEDAIMLRIFPITMKGAAKKWLKSQPSAEMDTWAKVKAQRFTTLSSWNLKLCMKPGFGSRIC